MSRFRSLLAAAVATPLIAMTPAASHVTPAAPATSNFYFDGAIHPYGNPHWCFYGALSTKIAIQTGTPVVLEKCALHTVHGHKVPIAQEYWHGYRVRFVGQAFLLAKPNYVLGRYKRKPPAVFVPFEHTKDANNFIGFLLDRRGNWHIDIVDQSNKKPYYLIMPEHLQAKVTAYPMKWQEADLGIPKGWTDIVLLPTWRDVPTT